MSFNNNNGDCFCERCGHSWECKSYYSNTLKKLIRTEPTSCAKCKSKGWNKPRVYGGKYLDGLAPMAKRYKATGRKAAKLKPEYDFYAARGKLYTKRSNIQKYLDYLLELFEEERRKGNFKGFNGEKAEENLYHLIRNQKEEIEKVNQEIEILQNSYYSNNVRKPKNEQQRTLFN